jgi:NTE family protein
VELAITGRKSAQSIPRIGLALSGGGARGLAHIGVLKVLEREGIPVHLIAGTSMGGFIGASYAAGLSSAELEAEALRLSVPRQLLPLLDPLRPRRGHFHGSALMAYLAQRLGDRTFDQLRLPLALVAVDLNAGEKVILKEGSVLEAIRATIALPGLLSPVERGGQLLIDGGVLGNLPADVVRQMGADLVVVVDVTTDTRSVDLISRDLQQRRFVPDRLVDLINVLWRSVVLMMREANRHSLEAGRPNLIIRPVLPIGVTILTGLTRAAEIISAGEQAAEEALPELVRLAAEWEPGSECARNEAPATGGEGPALPRRC